jgi:hypothetical protein
MWTMTKIAVGMSGEIAPKRRESASIPPAEAPITTTFGAAMHEG